MKQCCVAMWERLRLESEVVATHARLLPDSGSSQNFSQIGCQLSNAHSSTCSEAALFSTRAPIVVSESISSSIIMSKSLTVMGCNVEGCSSAPAHNVPSFDLLKCLFAAKHKYSLFNRHDNLQHIDAQSFVCLVISPRDNQFPKYLYG